MNCLFVILLFNNEKYVQFIVIFQNPPNHIVYTVDKVSNFDLMFVIIAFAGLQHAHVVRNNQQKIQSYSKTRLK